VVPVTTAEEMRAAVMSASEEADAVIMAAAVADFRPKAIAADKIKKELGTPEIVLEPTPDILRELADRPAPPVLVGFAAETADAEREGRRKLDAKRLDLVVANEVGRAGTGFGAETNRAAILAADGRDEPMRLWTKPELAAAICDRLQELLHNRDPG
jgi:phosphopantothenoylcysteine decarboxylase / phosphopantothenate---cysteine ligase